MNRTDLSRPGQHVGVYILLWCAGLYLRVTVLAAPPLAPIIGHDLGLSETALGMLTTLPGLLLALAAIPGAFLVARVGAKRTLVYGLALTGIASALRGAAAEAVVLYTMTFLMGVGIAVMQPAFASIVRSWTPRHVGFATAVYTNGLLVGEVLSAGLTLPVVLPAVGGSWRASFVVWSVPALAVAAAVALKRQPVAAAAPPAHWWPDWRDPNAWLLGIFMGGVSSLYLGTNAYLPGFLHAGGEGGWVTAALTALNGSQLVASGLLLVFSRRLTGRRWPLVAVPCVAVAALALLAFVPGAWAVVASAVIGFCCSFLLILVFALPPLLGGPERAHSLSAAMFSLAYTSSFVVPLVGGMVWDNTGIARAVFLPSGVYGLVIVALALSLRLKQGPHTD